jgi:hypothetical protein
MNNRKTWIIQVSGVRLWQKFITQIVLKMVCGRCVVNVRCLLYLSLQILFGTFSAL